MPDTDNGRITLAVLSEQMAQMQKTLEGIRRIVESDHDCLTSMNTHQADTDEKLKAHETDIEALKKTSTAWGGINTALAIMAGVIASILGTRQ
jgi:hypothetical protein